MAGSKRNRPGGKFTGAWEYSNTGKKSRSTTKSRDAVQQNGPRPNGFYGRYTNTVTTPEKKFFDVRKTTGVQGSSAVIYNSLNLVKGGSGVSERIGRSITAKSIHIRGTILRNAGTPYDKYRIVLILDSQCNGQVAALTDIFVPGPNNLIEVESFLNLANSKRFRVLRDMKLKSETGVWNGTDYGQGFDFFNMDITFNLPIEFATSGESIADVKTNNICLVIITQHGSLRCSTKFISRLRYTDQ